MKYYRLIVNGYEKTAGVLHAPETWPYPIARDTEEVKNWQSLVIELRDGIYCRRTVLDPLTLCHCICTFCHYSAMAPSS